ncbi:MAG: hypothetical protein PHS93_08935 [Candidatus Omnitrophica bacterium]|jgi:reverse gyrase|nr:hypothetical protein [Candidatus Omnitrophota bacterium]
MKVYLIDSSNNNKIIAEFDSKKEIKDYLNRRFAELCSNETKKQFFERFWTMGKDELESRLLPKFGFIPLYYS